MRYVFRLSVCESVCLSVRANTGTEKLLPRNQCNLVQMCVIIIFYYLS